MAKEEIKILFAEAICFLFFFIIAYTKLDFLTPNNWGGSARIITAYIISALAVGFLIGVKDLITHRLMKR